MLLFQAVTAEALFLPKILESELFQNVPAPRVLQDRLGIDALRSQSAEGVFDCKALGLRSVAFVFDEIVLKMDAELAFFCFFGNFATRMRPIPSRPFDVLLGCNGAVLKQIQ